MYTNDNSSTGLSEVKNTELKSNKERVLYSKVFGSMMSQEEKYGRDSVISSIKSDGFFFKVKNQSYYADYIKGTYDSVIRRVVSTAQVDYLLNNQETYNEINKKN
jgi:hypothetical protein